MALDPDLDRTVYQCFFRPGSPSSKYCLHTRDKFHHAEWLGDIIVRTEIQTFYLIKLRTFCGHHDHGNLPYFRHLPDLSQDRISVIPRKHDVQQDQIRDQVAQFFKQLLTIFQSLCLKSCGMQGIYQQFPNISLILNAVNHKSLLSLWQQIFSFCL